VHRKCIPKYNQQDATLHSFLFLETVLQVWVDSPPIIRSTTLYLQHLEIVIPLLLSAAIVEGLKLFHLFQDSCR